MRGRQLEAVPDSVEVNINVQAKQLELPLEGPLGPQLMTFHAQACGRGGPTRIIPGVTKNDVRNTLN